MVSFMLAHSRLAFRATTAASKTLAPLTHRHLLPSFSSIAVVAPSTHAHYYYSTSGSTSSAADIISAWKTSILQKPILIEHDTIRPQTLQMLAMTLNKSTPSSSTLSPPAFPNGTPLPVNWHHVFFPPMIGESDLGEDGYEMTHAPPAPFLARMWAGGGVEQNPGNLLRVGQEMVMKTRCTSVDVKESRDGKVMVFVSLEKVVENEQGVALTDSRTLVYMEKDRENPVKPKLVKRESSSSFFCVLVVVVVVVVVFLYFFFFCQF
jgi:3-methylfumaryl-CoA hydratase